MLSGCRANESTAKPAETKAMPAPAPPRVLDVKPEGPPARLVVVLHGVGADADDLLPVARALSPTLPDAEWLVADGFHPFSGGGTGREWFSIVGITEENRGARVKTAAEAVARWIDDELAARKLGWDRLVLLGFSQGSILANWLAVHRGPRAVVAFSGRFADVAEPGSPHDPIRTNTPVLVVHGARDPVIPVSNADDVKKALEARGARVTVSIHPALGHGIDAQGIDEARAFLAREAK